MRARFRSMTLETLLQQHGITTIKELMHRTGLSRQHCWSLWHGYDGVGKATAKRLHERLGIPAAAPPCPRARRSPSAAEGPPVDPAKGGGMTTPDYDTDFYAWTQAQAAALRAGQWEALDIEHVAEELEDLWKFDRHNL